MSVRPNGAAAERVADLTAEISNPDVLGPVEEDILLRGAPWRRFVVLGDSVAQGVSEPVAGYAGLSWADRVAAGLRRQRPVAYRNLGQEGLRAREVRETQLETALAEQPDLAALVCGGNDLFADPFAPGTVERELETMISELRDAGADVLTFTMFDITAALEMPPQFGSQLREQLHELFDCVRSVSARHGALLVELNLMAACADSGIYASDFRHANDKGHAIAAAATIRRIGQRLGNVAPAHQRASEPATPP